MEYLCHLPIRCGNLADNFTLNRSLNNIKTRLFPPKRTPTFSHHCLSALIALGVIGTHSFLYAFIPCIIAKFFYLVPWHQLALPGFSVFLSTVCTTPICSQICPNVVTAQKALYVLLVLRAVIEGCVRTFFSDPCSSLQVASYMLMIQLLILNTCSDFFIAKIIKKNPMHLEENVAKALFNKQEPHKHQPTSTEERLCTDKWCIQGFYGGQVLSFIQLTLFYIFTLYTQTSPYQKALALMGCLRSLLFLSRSMIASSEFLMFQ